VTYLLLTVIVLFLEDIPMLLLNKKTTKYFLVSVKKNNILFYFILMICFGHLTIIRPHLQNLDSGTCSTNNIHVIWDPMTYKYMKIY